MGRAEAAARGVGRTWVHQVILLPSRLVLETQVGPRVLALAAWVLASVALVAATVGKLPALLVDDWPAYPGAILQVFGVVRHRRRRNRHQGRRKHPDLKPPPGLLVGIVHKVRDAQGKLVRVTTRAWAGRKRALVTWLQRARLGRTIHTAHIERLNGSLRSRQGRLARRTRHGSRQSPCLQWSLWLWRDLTNWVWPHGSLPAGQTPALAAGLTDHPWTVRQYLRYPVHIDALTRAIWAEERQETLISALDRYQARKRLPAS